MGYFSELDIENKESLCLPFGNDLNQYAKAIHEIAIDQGYWDNGHSFHYTIANAMAELGEALSEQRDANPALYYKDANGLPTTDIAFQPVNAKPYGVGVELVDCMIWLMDYMAFMKIDIDEIMRRKVRYNATRGYLHGHAQP